MLSRSALTNAPLLLAACAAVAHADPGQQTRADQLRSLRAELGGPDSPAYKAAAEEARRAIAEGRLDVRKSLFSPEALGITFDSGAPLAPAPGAPLRAAHARSSRGSYAPSYYYYFDGAETYAVDTTPGDGTFSPRMNQQVGPSGSAVQASSMFVAVTLPQPAFVDGSTFQYSPAVPVNPRQLPIDAPWNADPNGAVQQAIMDGRGSRLAGGGVHVGGTFLGVRFNLGRANPNGTVAPPPSSGSAYLASVDRDLVVAMDFYLGDHETEVIWTPNSYLEGLIVSRLFASGVRLDLPLADPDGRIRRPLMLGLRQDTFLVGALYATPTLGGPGQPPTFQTKLNEWWTIAVRVTVRNEMEWWVRDSGTDGASGVYIDDPLNIPYFESGWANLFPGRDPGPGAPLGPLTAYAGYGRAVDEYGAPGPARGEAPAAISCADVFTLITRGPIDVLPLWKPTNTFMDNLLVMGEQYFYAGAQPSLQSLVVPYADDIERSIPSFGLRWQGGRWVDNIWSGATISNEFNTTVPPDSTGAADPSLCIVQESAQANSVMRNEFWTRVPPGSSSSADYLPSDRAFARPGAPVCAGATLRVSDTSAVRALRAVEWAFDEASAMLLLGATDPATDAVTPVFHVRLANPLFDPLARTSSDARVDDLPDLADNAPLINWPTTRPVGLSAFQECELTLHADGTGEWSVDGVPLEFDGAFYSQDQRLQDELRKAKRIQLGLPGATPLSDPALAPPYTRFLSTQKSLDVIELWSGNNAGSLGNRLYVDDVRVSGPPRELGPGPAFTLPYCDDFSLYTTDEVIAGQGTTPDSAVLGAGQLTQSAPRARWINAPSFGAPEPSCVYTVIEALAGGGAWGIGPGSTVQVRKPFAGYACPPPLDALAGKPNFRVVDPAGVRPALELTVAAPTETTDDAAGASLRAGDDRHGPASHFCRYAISSAVVRPNLSEGGAPFTLPPGFTPGALVAVDAPFGPNSITGIRPCPGSISTGGIGVAWAYALVNARRDYMATGQLVLQATNIVPNPCGSGTPVGSAAGNPPAADLRGYEYVLRPTARWLEQGNASEPDGRAGDGVLRSAAGEVDETAMQSIDRADAFGQALAFVNTTPTGAETILPVASAGLPVGDAPRAGLFWDVYAQDANNRWTFSIHGDEADCNGGRKVVAAIRLGNPAAVPPSTTIHIATTSNLQSFADTGVPYPVGSWFRLGFVLDGAGNWSLGLNTLGAPGGPAGLGNDVPRHFAIPGLGAPHPASAFVASGTALSTVSVGGARIHTISALSVLQGLDSAGDGVAEVPVIIEALGAEAPRPAGLGAFDFCFYEVSYFDDDNLPRPLVRGVSPYTGATFAGTRSLSHEDIVAVRFNSAPGDGPVVDSFARCPNFARFVFTNAGPNPATAHGVWTLTGVPDSDSLARPVAGGISNAAGPASGFAYNDPNPNRRTILLARFVEIPPPYEMPSRLWIDNLCLEELPANAGLCPSDLTGDGLVNSADLAFMLGAWGPCAQCPQDMDASGFVNAADLAQLLGAWGTCP